MSNKFMTRSSGARSLSVMMMKKSAESHPVASLKSINHSNMVLNVKVQVWKL